MQTGKLDVLCTSGNIKEMLVIPSHRPVPAKNSYDAISNPFLRFSVRVLAALDLLVYALVGVAFFSAAALALLYSVTNMLNSSGVSVILSGAGFAQNLLSFVSDLLLVLIIMEVLGTIRSYLEKGDTSVIPFLFIGIISATRGILSIGAQLSIDGDKLTSDQFKAKMIELGINALVIVALGATIRILGNYATNRESAEEQRKQIATGTSEVPAETTIPAQQHHESKPE
jgi:uncharacterized membrane protein (DUF373 family)